MIKGYPLFFLTYALEKFLQSSQFLITSSIKLGIILYFLKTHLHLLIVSFLQLIENDFCRNKFSMTCILHFHHFPLCTYLAHSLIILSRKCIHFLQNMVSFSNYHLNGSSNCLILLI